MKNSFIILSLAFFCFGCKSYYTPKTKTSFEYVVFEPRVNKLNVHEIKNLKFQNYYWDSFKLNDPNKDFLIPMLIEVLANNKILINEKYSNLKSLNVFDKEKFKRQSGFFVKHPHHFFNGDILSLNANNNDYILFPVFGYKINYGFCLEFIIAKNTTVIYHQLFAIYYKDYNLQENFKYNHADFVVRKLLNNIGYEN